MVSHSIAETTTPKSSNYVAGKRNLSKLTKEKKDLSNFEAATKVTSTMNQNNGELSTIQRKMIQKSMSARSNLLAEVGKNLQDDSSKFRKQEHVTEADEQLLVTEINEEYDDVVRHHHNLVYHQHKFTTHFNQHSSDRRESGEAVRIEIIYSQEQKKLVKTTDLKDIVAEYSTLQSPSRAERRERQLKKELYQECQLIKQDGDTIVANQGKGFFGKTDQIDQHILDFLLPKYEDDSPFTPKEPKLIQFSSL